MSVDQVKQALLSSMASKEEITSHRAEATVGNVLLETAKKRAIH